MIRKTGKTCPFCGSDAVPTVSDTGIEAHCSNLDCVAGNPASCVPVGIWDTRTADKEIVALTLTIETLKTDLRRAKGIPA